MDFWTEVLRHNWTPNGDTTLTGGITIAFYGLTSLLCLISASRGRTPLQAETTAHGSPCSGLRLRGPVFLQNSPLLNLLHPLCYFDQFWLKMGLLFFVLALHKYFNWLVGLTNFIRNRAYYYAWYSSRRSFQNQFILVAIVLTLLILVWILWRMRNGPKAKMAAVAGLFFIVVFVVVRSISSHSVDAFIYYRYMGWIQLNRLVELGCIGVVAISALCSWRR